VPSETHKQKEKDSSAKYLAHSTTTLTTPSPHSDDANIVLIDTLEIEEQLATTITDGTRIGVERETSLTNAQIASINQKKGDKPGKDWASRARPSSIRTHS